MTVKLNKLRKGEFVVYPTHGVGQVVGTEQNSVGGATIELLVLEFEHDRLQVRIPTARAKTAGLRGLSTRDTMDEVIKTLKGRSRNKRTMWARRAVEYETKINSGDPLSIAEVARDLFKPESQVDQSFSERQLFQTAIGRLAREYAVIEKIEYMKAEALLVEAMNKKLA